MIWSLLISSALAADPVLFQSKPLTASGQFTKGIEGPGVDRNGRLFVVNYREQGTVGEVILRPPVKMPAEVVEAFRLPAGSIGNAIRFDKNGVMYVADYTHHNVFSREGSTAAKVIFHSDDLHQPNDLTVSFDGDLYLSDPDWKKGGGALWHVRRDGDRWTGHAMKVPRVLGTVNGIDLSPDDRTLHVSESGSREIWSYRIDGDELRDPKLLIKFKDFSLDGLRTDVDGSIYATRIEKGTIVKLKPDGSVLREISLLGKNPSNLAFGGEDGRTVYVTETVARRVETFIVDRPGREWSVVHGRRPTENKSR